MKMDIEKYLMKNRLKLDAEQPDDTKTWNEIRNQTGTVKSAQGSWFWKIAAVFLFGVLITYIVVKETQHDRIVIVSLADISSDLGNQEAELKKVVDTKWNEIGPLTTEQKSEFQFLLNELAELDTIYKTYEKDLYTTGENEQIVNVLLDYYQKKLRVLNRLALEIQKQKNNENNFTL